MESKQAKRASFHLPCPWHRLPEEDISQIKVGSSYLRRSELKGDLPISNDLIKKKFPTGQWWHIPLIQALRKPSQVDLYELEASLVYIKSEFQVSQAYTNKPCHKKRKKSLIGLSSHVGFS